MAFGGDDLLLPAAAKVAKSAVQRRMDPVVPFPLSPILEKVKKGEAYTPPLFRYSTSPGTVQTVHLSPYRTK